MASGLCLGPSVCAGCYQPRLRLGPSRRYLCESVLTCLDLYPGSSSGASTRFFPDDFGLPYVVNRSALSFAPRSDFSTAPYFGAVVIRDYFRPARLLATPVAPTTASISETSSYNEGPSTTHASLLIFRLNPQGSRGFSIRAPYSVLPSCTSNMLVV
jgi:hypothetical protein